jgi:transglutaminase-like putative cysteine protease
MSATVATLKAAGGELKAPGASAPLDVKNVLWLLAAMVFVVGPHLLRLPTWVTMFFLVVVAWRAWISLSALRSPPWWFLWLVTFATTYGTFLTYGRIFGREAGVTLLIIMAALKLLEMRSQRDVILAIYLGFFLVMTNFLFSQAIPLGVYMLACVWIFIATLVGFNRVGRPPTLRERLRPAGALLVQALPLMVAFFILFPRTQGPLWALPQDARAGQTGLSETMSPGNIANLIKSDQVAFRVQFENGMPPYRSLYWRGPVLVDFDGATWKMRAYASQGHMDYTRQERPSKYVVTLEPHQKTWMFALDVPGSRPDGAQLLSDLQLRYRRPITERMRYEMLSYLNYRFGESANRVQLEQALRLDEQRNPKTIALGRQWAKENPDPRALLGRAAQFFGRSFVYTLEPPPLDRSDPFDDFVFNSRQGFCEHFAGAFTLIMRAAGVPARVVTGYQGGEVNPINNELIVRQADAHAWAEIWVKDEGWVRIDPTAVVSPMRVENGVNAALGPIGLVPSLIDADKLGVLANLRFAWQVLNSNWDAWVVGYNMDRQRQFFSGMGMPDVDWRTLGFWLMIAIFAAGAAVAIGLLVHDRPAAREPSLIAWNRYCSKLAAAGLARAPHEGPVDYLRRVGQKRPELAKDIEEITRRYVEARYGTGATREDIRALSKLVRQFRPA